MDKVDLIKICEEGSAAALANQGIGRWKYPYLKLIDEAKKNSQSTTVAEWVVDTWDDGWTEEMLKMRMVPRYPPKPIDDI